MKQEDKELLLKDLCSRLPYGVICTDSRQGDSKITEIDVAIEIIYCDDFDEYIEIKDCKPYLRPMSSITEEELDKYEELEWAGDFETLSLPLLDWLNRKMFDYRGLIEKGLALEAKEGMYN